MPILVIDAFEIIYIENLNTYCTFIFESLSERCLSIIVEVGAVRQSGERIVLRLRQQCLFAMYKLVVLLVYELVLVVNLLGAQSLLVFLNPMPGIEIEKLH